MSKNFKRYLEERKKQKDKEPGIIPMNPNILMFPELPNKEEKVPNKRPPQNQVMSYETITCACGHQAPFPIYSEKNDKHREERRKRHQERHCADCRKKEHEERQRQEKESKKKRSKEGKGPSWLKEAARRASRLPDGAKFTLLYDASKELWQGELAVVWEGKLRIFSGQGSGVFRLLEKLDVQFRKVVEVNETSS
jgi:hypothetical protein